MNAVSINVETFALILGIIAAFWGTAHKVSGILFTISKIEKDLVEVTDRMDVIMDFLMRRSLSEVVGRGFGTPGETTMIPSMALEGVTQEVRGWFAPILEEMKLFYKTHGYKLTDRELFIKIESLFGSRLLTEVCIPRNMNSGACILIAATLMKE